MENLPVIAPGTSSTHYQLTTFAQEHIGKLERDGQSYKGKLNIYTCQGCRGHIVTRDVDTGVTPFMVGCRATVGCKGMMQSSMYRVADQKMRAGFIWYRPKSGERMFNHAELEHLVQGGLLLREATSSDEA